MSYSLTPFYLKNDLFQLDFPTDRQSYGGKGRSLIELAERHVSIPNSVLFRLDEIQQRLKRDIPGYLCGPGDEILRWQMPCEWESTLSEIQKFLNGPLIVRSSMSCEDLPHTSLSGCFESIVIPNPTLEQIWNAFVRVLASGLGVQSNSRLLDSGVSLRSFQVGCLIQKWIAPKLAGVCLSRNPRNLWQKSGSIDWGRNGESVVQGKELLGTLNEGEPLDTESDLHPFVDSLWQLARDLDRVTGGPVDIEWVWDGCKLWIVQYRPVATEEAELIRNTQPGNTWSRELTQERFPEAVTPLGWSALEDVFSTAVKSLDRDFGIVVNHAQEIAICYEGFVYSNPELFRFPEGIRIRWSHLLSPWKRSFWGVFRVVLGSLPKWFQLNKSQSIALLQVKFIDALLGHLAEREIQGWNNHQADHLRQLEEFNQKLEKINEFSPRSLLEAMEELRTISCRFMEPDISIFLMKDTIFRSLRRLWVELGNSEMDFLDCIDFRSGNRTIELCEEWKGVHALLNADPNYSLFMNHLETGTWVEAISSARLLPQSDRALRDFLSKYGHIRTQWDLAEPSLGESSEQLLQLLRGSSINPALKGGVSLCSMKKSGEGVGLDLEFELIHRMLRRLEGLMRIDEEQHFLAGAFLVPSRKLIHRAEEILIEKRVLENPGAIYFLHLAEIKAQLADPDGSLERLAARRRTSWERNKHKQRSTLIPEENSPKASPQGQVGGVGVSAGVGKGPIYFLERFEDAGEIPRGAILVTTAPNPSFVPLYSSLSGMVSVTGGPLSHGFLAAREYGLPAVSGVKNAYQVFEKGAWVEIDGSTGSIEFCRGGP